MSNQLQDKVTFPASFWTANTIELFERAAYYGMSSFMVIYLTEVLGMSPVLAGTLNGSLLWGLIYFLPFISGTLADRFGFKKSLSLAFVMLLTGYVVLGKIKFIWPALLGHPEAGVVNYAIPAIIAIILIGIGGSIVKPCVAGTVQKTSGLHATLGFGIFYMIINIGSISGRITAYLVRTKLGIQSIFFPVATIFALIGLVVALVIFREPQYVSDGKKDSQAVKVKSLKEVFVGMVTVLGNVKFVFFLVVLGLFWILYLQLYTLMPLYLRFLDPNAPVDLYTLANPVMIVALQLLITRFSKRFTPVKSIMFGIAVTICGMALNILPPFLFGNIAAKTTVLGVLFPLASIFMILSIASMALGEMLASPRIYEYIGAIAPKGEEGLYMGYANLPLAIGSLIAGPMGGYLFQTLIKTPHAKGLPTQSARMWTIICLTGLVSFAGMAIYNRWVFRKTDVARSA